MRVLGFPIHVKPGFLVFMVLIVGLYRDEFGVWLAGSIAAFTLLHELGHAVAARRAGATAEISLDFLAGYASYTSERPLSRSAEAGIALAGPVTHITAGLLVLVAMGVNPLVAVERGQHVGVGRGVVGGRGDRRVQPDPGAAARRRQRRDVGARPLPARAGPSRDDLRQPRHHHPRRRRPRPHRYRGLTVFLAFLLMMQLQMIFEEREDNAVSPFDDAAAALRDGDEAKAVRIVVKAMRRESPRPLVPAPLPDDELRRLLAALPRPLPTGDPWTEYVLANLLVHGGQHREAAEYGAASYARTHQPLLAATIARAAAGLGDETTATNWLREAIDSGASREGIATIIDRAPELATVRQRPGRRRHAPRPAAHRLTRSPVLATARCATSRGAR